MGSGKGWPTEVQHLTQLLDRDSIPWSCNEKRGNVISSGRGRPREMMRSMVEDSDMEAQ